jgi:hypothetical protein
MLETKLETRRKRKTQLEILTGNEGVKNGGLRFQSGKVSLGGEEGDVIPFLPLLESTICREVKGTYAFPSLPSGTASFPKNSPRGGNGKRRETGPPATTPEKAGAAYDHADDPSPTTTE